MVWLHGPGSTFSLLFNSTLWDGNYIAICLRGEEARGDCRPEILGRLGGLTGGFAEAFRIRFFDGRYAQISKDSRSGVGPTCKGNPGDCRNTICKHQKKRDTLNPKLPLPKAFKRSPSLENSSWYKGILMSQLAGEFDTGGAFDLIQGKMRKGTEPPPHLHTREDEFFYVLKGSMTVYAEGQRFDVAAGECTFLPKGKPHAFLLQTDEIEVLNLITPGGFMNAIHHMNAPAQTMEIPADEVVTYATTDLTKTMELFENYGVRFLSPEEIAEQMPEFPVG